MDLCVVGQGYVGLSLSRAALESGLSVLGIDVDSKRVELLQDCGYPVTTDFSKSAEAKTLVLAVPTPLDDRREPDLSYLIEACRSLQPHVSQSTLIINESTSYPGTLREVIAPIFGEQYFFAVSPERVDPGNSRWHIQNTPRLVSGLNEESTKRALEFYSKFCREVHKVATPEIAELAKLLENSFRQINIALVNELAKVSEPFGISAFDVIEAASTKPFGFMPFQPSIGVGGHCIPVDPSYLSFAAKARGVNTDLINLANSINSGMVDYVIERIERTVQLKGKSIQISGISYKPGIADVRESPALRLIEVLRSKGCQVFWHDDFVKELNGEFSVPIRRVDIGIVCTAHPNVDYTPWKTSVQVFDVSNSLDSEWGKFL